MHTSITVPVDLEHVDRLGKASPAAADLVGHYGATIRCVGVTAATPGLIADSPGEFTRSLDEFARARTARHGRPVTGSALASQDPAAELARTLIEAVHETGADLVVMASHAAGMADAVRPSHDGRLASRRHPSSSCADPDRQPARRHGKERR